MVLSDGFNSCSLLARLRLVMTLCGSKEPGELWCFWYTSRQGFARELYDLLLDFGGWADSESRCLGTHTRQPSI